MVRAVGRVAVFYHGRFTARSAVVGNRSAHPRTQDECATSGGNCRSRGFAESTLESRLAASVRLCTHTVPFSKMQYSIRQCIVWDVAVRLELSQVMLQYSIALHP
mmetsp:Transcript_27783/g.65299  ORF Transcript_27783/g.65299 Transcript_27783/m.65299 type:complete len:105 (+) Transcript_27783:1226-1540(+)